MAVPALRSAMLVIGALVVAATVGLAGVAAAAIAADGAISVLLRSAAPLLLASVLAGVFAMLSITGSLSKSVDVVVDSSTVLWSKQVRVPWAGQLLAFALGLSILAVSVVFA